MNISKVNLAYYTIFSPKGLLLRKPEEKPTTRTPEHLTLLIHRRSDVEGYIIITSHALHKPSSSSKSSDARTMISAIAMQYSSATTLALSSGMLTSRSLHSG